MTHQKRECFRKHYFALQRKKIAIADFLSPNQRCKSKADKEF